MSDHANPYPVAGSGHSRGLARINCVQYSNIALYRGSKGYKIAGIVRQSLFRIINCVYLHKIKIYGKLQKCVHKIRVKYVRFRQKIVIQWDIISWV
jgi:hypothetical protein